MSRENFTMIFLWLVAIAVAVWAVIQTLSIFANYAPPIIAAVVTIYVALLNHSLAEEKELRMQQQREKQQNYEKLLMAAAEFIRDPDNSDAWDTVHLYSWVVASESVIRKTQVFTDDKDDKSLRSLLVEMRKDIGLKEPTSDDLMPKVFAPKGGSLKVTSVSMKERVK